jgi:hypothetical protein
MWSDNETTTDLLGFKVHADLIERVVTDANLLPVVLGVFGDWGGGKSSIMRMVDQSLNAKQDDNVACLYFNGWMFEGYEDAKTALLSSILVQLGEHKRFGPKVKEKVVGLLKRVKWMELAKVGMKHVGVPLAIGAMTGGIGAIPAAAASLAMVAATSGEQSKESESTGGFNWNALIREAPGEPDVLEMRKFRDEFQEMLDKTDIKSLVILIDDLDRCLPERIIETLEAIKLFVAVPKTAFIIGADPRIVRHAIATRYVKRQVGNSAANLQEEYDLVQDYLEKLIQIPYHLPRLSPAEIESYINLLACQKHLTGDQCNIVIENWSTKRSENLYGAYRQAAIRQVLNADAITEELERQLTWSNSVASAITEGLKGNPRQVKRMLNAMLLRKQLASVAGIRVRDEVLAKLMVLEYAYLPRFHQLNDWQSSEEGRPASLKKLEKWALSEDGQARATPDEYLSEWTTPAIKNWLRLSPALTDVDLRDYFWLARDRTGSTLAGIEMVPPIVRRLFDQLVGDNEGEQYIAVRDAPNLEEPERNTLLRLLRQQVESHPDNLNGPDALFKLAEYKLPGAAEALINSVSNASAKLLDPGVAFKIETIGKNEPELKDAAQDLLSNLAKTNTKIGKAADKSLKGWNGDGDVERIRSSHRR